MGDGNNMFASWANLGTRVTFDLVLVCPEGFELNGEVRAYAERETRGSLSVVNDPATGIQDADVVYTDVWASMGQEDEKSRRQEVFAPYQVNEALMARAKSDAVFMHCLPAHRGEEVTDAVIDGRHSVVFDEAENRLHAQKAVMVRLIGA